MRGFSNKKKSRFHRKGVRVDSHHGKIGVAFSFYRLRRRTRNLNLKDCRSSISWCLENTAHDMLQNAGEGMIFRDSGFCKERSWDGREESGDRARIIGVIG